MGGGFLSCKNVQVAVLGLGGRFINFVTTDCLLHFEKQHCNNVKSIVCRTFTDLGYIHCRSLKGKLKEEVLFFELLLCMFCTLASNCKKCISVYILCLPLSGCVLMEGRPHSAGQSKKTSCEFSHLYFSIFPTHSHSSTKWCQGCDVGNMTVSTMYAYKSYTIVLHWFGICYSWIYVLEKVSFPSTMLQFYFKYHITVYILLKDKSKVRGEFWHNFH